MKKGDLSFEMIITIILVLIVFVVLIILFHKQIGQILLPLKNIVGVTEGVEIVNP